MDKNSIIDKESFEVWVHAENHPKVFVCDKLIAPVVAQLNKKGYKTIASCSGHYKIEFYEYFDEPIDNLKNFERNKRVIIKKINNDTFDYWKEVDSTSIYILFANKYDFHCIPSDFVLENDERTYIGCNISFYDENGSHRKMKDVMNEIEDKCNSLYEWVNTLPNINN